MSQDVADVAVRYIDEDAICSAEAWELPADIEDFTYDLQEGPPKDRSGAVRGTLPDDFAGEALYLNSDSSCSISVKRLVWVDGWKGTVDGKTRGEDMTLVVLQLNFSPQAHGTKLTYASVGLVLGSDKKPGNGPEIVAWGPFRRQEMWNTTRVRRRFNVAPTLKLTGGVPGQRVTAGIDFTNDFTWDEVHSDYGRSSELHGTRRKRCNGVMWELFANPYKEGGITPEIRVAALFKRPSKDKYRVKINVTAHKGPLSRMEDGLMHLLNRTGGHGVVWRTTPNPGKKECCFGDGVAIAQALDLTRLGNLVHPSDSKSMVPAWLKTWDLGQDPEDEKADGKKAADDKKAGDRKAEDKEAKSNSIEGRTGENPAVGTARSQKDVCRAKPELVVTPPGPSASTAGIPPPYRLVADAPRPDTTGGDDTQHLCSPPGRDRPSAPPFEPHHHDRLVALEVRAARAEARIAEQDRLIADLQQTLVRVAQALLAPALNSGRAG